MNLKKILGAVGKLGKGAATIIGVLGTTLGVSLGGGDKLAECAAELAKSPDSAIAGAGALLALFGIARKAGWLARESTSGGSN